MAQANGEADTNRRRQEGRLYPPPRSGAPAPKIPALPILRCATESMPKAPAKIDIPATAAQVPATYEAALSELEALVQRLESGDMPLDELLTGYQRGTVLLQTCRDKLQAVEDQIKVLDAGVLKPWKAT